MIFNMETPPCTTDQNSNAPPQPVAPASSGNPIENILNQNPDIVINDYMERLGTRLSMLETELKYAWRALDLLSQEYVKMWERLEKLEVLLYEQQTVISQLLDFYSNVEGQNNQLPSSSENAEQMSGDGNQMAVATIGMPGTTSELDALQQVLNMAENSARENDLIGMLNPSGSGLSAEASEIIKELQLEDMLHLSDEAFYRSLNKAYREDLVGFDTNAVAAAASASSQLGMIWEEAEEGEENGSMTTKKETSEGMDMTSGSQIKDEDTHDVFSALDYKDYRNNIPCVNEDDLAQISRLSAIDQVALEKLHELDRLTNKLQKDSQDLKELQNRLLDPSSQTQDQTSARETNAETTERNFTAEDTSLIDEQLRQIYSESEIENWSFSSSPRGLAEMLLLAGITSGQGSKQRGIGDGGGTGDTDMSSLSGYRSTGMSLSPRHRMLDSSYSSPSRMSSLLPNDLSSSPKHSSDLQSYSSYSGLSSSPKRIGDTDTYSYGNLTGSPKHTVDLQTYSYGTASTSPKHSELQGYNYGGDSSGLVSASFSSVACTSPSIYSVSSGKLSSSPTLSIVSVRTRQDGYISGARLEMDNSPSPTSPPPPAPQDKEVFMMSKDATESSLSPSVALFGAAGGSTSITSLSLDQQQGRLTPRTPHSPKSPRTSPKRIVKSSSSNIAAAKSDSGLSSMSGGWSSIEKSPGSPKSSKTPNASSYTSSETGILLGRVQCHTHSRSYSATHLNTSPKHRPKSPYRQESDPYTYSRALSPLPSTSATSGSLLPGGHHLSAFTSVRTPTGMDSSSPSVTNDSSGTFVPSPAPSSDVSTSPSRRSQRLTDFQSNIDPGSDYLYRSEKPAIYSVAGSHRQPYTSVYTSGSSNYNANVTTSGYPDLIGPYPISDTHSGSSSSSQYLAGSEQGTSRSHSTSTSVYPTPTTTPTQYPGSKKPSGVSNLDSYKTAMYRTMFPTGQITDALSYYPTSAHETSTPANVPTTYYQSPNQWLSRSVDSSTQLQQQYERERERQRYSQDLSYSKPSLMDPSAQYRAEEGYPITDYQWNRRDWNSELDVRNQNLEYSNRYQDSQFYDTTGGVIVSQSGYISIASDMKDENEGYEKTVKKNKRGGSLKSVMSQVSNLLPDLHLNKRHRSNSLPASEFPEDLESKPKTSLRGKLQKQLTQTIARRGKGGKALVSTVSGMIQKAKKRAASHSSQSLSDPEQSELEWGSATSGLGSGRASALSVGSEDSVFSDAPADLFAKMPVKSDTTKSNTPTEEQPELITKLPELDLPVDDFDDEETNKIPSSVSSLFPTVGEIKQSQKSTTGSSDESVTSETAIKFPPVAIGGASREFAVSRALGKYRQRQSSTVSDEPGAQEDSNHSGNSGSGKENNLVRTPDEVDEIETLPKDKSKEKVMQEEKKAPIIETPPPPPPPPPPSIVPQPIPQITPQTSEETGPIQSSPSLQSVRSSQRHPPARHQQSLEIPWGFRSSGDGDDDTRSTHSWRSTSRVSSRRQSTEDSIDSEDEWYCYELRKLEELEKQTQIEKEMMESVERYKPDDRVKTQMSFVLQELRLKASQISAYDESQPPRITGVMREGISELTYPDSEEKDLSERRKSFDRRPSMERRSSIERRKLPEMPDRRNSFERRHSRELPQRPNEIIQPMEIKKPESDEEKEHSSGDTSGPDSPHQSQDDMEYDEQIEAEESRRSSNGYQNKLPTSGSLSREGSESVPPSEMSVSIPGEWNSEETATVRDGSISVQGSEWENDVREGDSASTVTPSTQKAKIEDTIKEKESEEGKEDIGKDMGPGSKWKLLKALKERKLEEKEAKAEAAAAVAAAISKTDDTATSVSIVNEYADESLG